MSASTRTADPELPDELVVMEMVTRLPGKQVVRCKSVCKLWRSMIESARFKDVYGSRHRGVIHCWLKQEPGTYSPVTNFLSFNYSPIRRLKEPKEEAFDCLSTLEIRSSSFLRVTQIVNGLLCAYDAIDGFILYNVCTGERMKIPGLLPREEHLASCSFYLGYDPSTRVYKLLRLTGHPTRAEIITLGSSSTRRELNCDASGIPGDCCIKWSDEQRVSPCDGFLCWDWDSKSAEGLVLFDISKEKFHKVCLPDEYYCLDLKEMCVRAQFMEHNKRLAVSLWCISQRGCVDKPAIDFSCFVMRDDEGKRWTKRVLKFPRRMMKNRAVLVAADWNSCKMVMMDKRGSNVYCYGRRQKMARFQIGEMPLCTRTETPPRPHWMPVSKWDWYCPISAIRVFYLFDANNLYLPLAEILRGSN